MRFKLVDRSQVVEPIAWRSLDPLAPTQDLRVGPQPLVIAPHKASQQPPPPPQPEGPNLELELANLERRHQAALVSARQEAFALGVEQTRAEALNELKAGADRVAHALADLATTKKRIRQESEVEMIKLSLAIAKRILHREIMSDPEALHGLVHAALQKLSNREVSRVRVYPAAKDAIRSALERIGAAPAIEICPDPSLKSGDLVFETSFGDLDASIDTQLQEIQRGFADRLAGR